ncbi:uncharacterized protein LOC144647517 [Oculina patagonica]
MDQQTKVLILGHSFVRRFKLFVSEGIDERTYPDLDLSAVDLHFLGIGGRTVPKTRSFDLEDVRALQPEIVILEIGSNDLCEVGLRPETVGSNIESFVCTLHEVCKVAYVMVCQVIHRASPPSHSPQYNADVDILNQYLQVVLEPLPFAEFWSHKGLKAPNIPIFRRDGVHLNDQANYALYRSYRGAILCALKRVASGRDINPYKEHPFA